MVCQSVKHGQPRLATCCRCPRPSRRPTTTWRRSTSSSAPAAAVACTSSRPSSPAHTRAIARRRLCPWGTPASTRARRSRPAVAWGWCAGWLRPSGCPERSMRQRADAPSHLPLPSLHPAKPAPAAQTVAGRLTCLSDFLRDQHPALGSTRALGPLRLRPAPRHRPARGTDAHRGRSSWPASSAPCGPALS